MCLAVPLRIKEIDGLNCICEREGIEREARLDFVKDPKVGDYVLIHAGFAIEKMSEEQAKLDIEACKEVEEEIRKLYV